ncbi:uncharacterized protein LOC142987854 [Anticarsia gemmatalis]|uniref:uncharacterized protein LOC142987854 n=1 Tax=Anticarsia gemmatalis TaxID=129554 RepID=UPI003F77595C
MTDLKGKVRCFFNCLRENSCVNLIRLINFLPKLAGFPLLSSKFNVSFWILHTTLLLYVYILGTIVYQMYFADGFIDAINSFFNIYVFILIFNTSWWLLQKRKGINEALKLVKQNDQLVIDSGKFLDRYQKLLRRIQIIIMLCYAFHFVNDIMIFIPSRTLGMDDFSTVSCVGLEPLTSSPNRQICMVILAVQELTAIVAVGSYDVILLFLFAHTTAIFLILNEDMKKFQDITNKFDGSIEMCSIAADYLKNLAIRHSLALRTVKKLQDIYSASIGVGFGLDALSLCLFFVLPLDVCLNFAPLIYHCLFVFFLYCFQGQRLTTASEKFEMEVYCCGWEKLRVKEQKYILLMLKVAQKPVILYAAGVVPIRIHTFANTMQSIYKFVTIFRL